MSLQATLDKTRTLSVARLQQSRISPSRRVSFIQVTKIQSKVHTSIPFPFTRGAVRFLRYNLGHFSDALCPALTKDQARSHLQVRGL